MFEKGSCCLFMCCSSQEACFRREINVPSGMASLLCCRSSMRAAIPTVTSPMPTPFLRYPHSTSPSKEAVKWLVLASFFSFFLLSVLLWKLVGKIVMWPLFFWQLLLSQLSVEAMSFVTEDRKTAQESTFPNTYTFDLFGGVDVSLTFLWCYWTEAVISEE